jgi:hypothetical protein
MARSQVGIVRKRSDLEDFDEAVMKSDETDDEMMIVTTDSRTSLVHHLCQPSRLSKCLDSLSSSLLYPTECRSLLLVSGIFSLRRNHSNLLLLDIELKKRMLRPSQHSST